MKRIMVVGPKKDSHRIVDVLYTCGTVHLEDVSKKISENEIAFRKCENKIGEEISNLLVKIGGIFLTLPTAKNNTERQLEIYKDLYWKRPAEITERTNHVISELEVTTKNLAKEKSDLEIMITALTRYEKTIKKIRPLEEQIPLLEGFEVTVLLLQKEFKDLINIIKQELLSITKNQFELVSTEIDEDTIAAITVFNKRYSEKVHSFIFSKNINEFRMPSEYIGKPFSEVIELLDAKRSAARDRLASIHDTMTNLSEEWYQELKVLKTVLEEKYREFEVYSQFGQTNYTFAVMGWIPKIYFEATKEALLSDLGTKVVILERPVVGEEYGEAPTLYANPRFVKPFELFMQLVRPPSYAEIDPSPLLAIFFPIFFGLMVGDIGYGIVILIIALVMRKKFPDLDWVQSLGAILIISSFPAMFFGFLYGEFFGNFGEMMGWIHPVHFFGVTWNRVEAIIPLLMFAIAIGIIHVFVGLILGIINAITAKKKKHVIEKVGMLTAITGLILVLGCAAEMLPAGMMTPSIAVVIIALPLIIYGAGALGPLEIMGTVGNILSYARLMAIGMASVILAVVANELGGSFSVVLVGVVVAALLHALNIMLAMFSPTLHSIRLHMVECFSKFYEGGGKMYRPFKKEGDSRD